MVTIATLFLLLLFMGFARVLGPASPTEKFKRISRGMSSNEVFSVLGTPDIHWESPRSAEWTYAYAMGLSRAFIIFGTNGLVVDGYYKSGFSKNSERVP